MYQTANWQSRRFYMKPKPKIEELREFIKARGLVSSNDIRTWGHKNFYGSARTRCQDMAREGNFIRRLTEQEIHELRLRRPGSAPVAWWTLV
jgi:hypothetical protein